MGKFIDLTGQKFGRLIVLERVENYIQPNGTIKARWKCLCECGKHCVVCSSELRCGKTKSCGCFKLGILRTSRITHGKSSTRLYGVWKDMKARCYNPNDKYYHVYGAEGKAVCEEWRNNFQAFYDWSMSHGYDENAPRGECTIDRIDGTKGYSPDNCRWSTNKEQANNRRSNHMITFNNETHTLAEWAKITGISCWAIKYRLKANWTIEKTLNTPTK